MRPNTVKHCDFICILYSKLLRECKKPTFKIGDRVRNSKFGLPFCKDYKLPYTWKFFETVAIGARKPTTYTIKDEQDEIIQGKFYQKELIEVI